MYKCAIFDLDGTLLNTLRDLTSSVNFALRSFGFPERTTEEVRSFIGNGVKKLMERSVPAGTDKSTEEKCLDCFRSHYLLHMSDTTAPYEGIIELLDRIKAKGIKTAIVSNKLHSAVVELSKKEFGNRIDIAYGVSDEEERKPNPINIFKVIEKFKLQKEECIYLGDSDVDIMTAHNAGVKCVGVTWGFRSRAFLEEHGADLLADTAGEALEIIDN